MEIKRFRNHYGLELITASHAGISIGDLVWDRLTATPLFSHKNMPNTIYNAFLDANLIDKEEYNTFREECRNIKMIDAHLADKKIDVSTEMLSELKHPTLGSIEGDFKLETINKVKFENPQVRIMDDLLRVKIDQYLELMKKNKWQEYDGRIRRVHMITELYYGSVKLVVERTLGGKMDTALDKAGIKILAKSEGSKSVEYEFENDEVPFAMRIEQVRTFNG